MSVRANLYLLQRVVPTKEPNLTLHITTAFPGPRRQGRGAAKAHLLRVHASGPH